MLKNCRQRTWAFLKAKDSWSHRIRALRVMISSTWNLDGGHAAIKDEVVNPSVSRLKAANISGAGRT